MRLTVTCKADDADKTIKQMGIKLATKSVVIVDVERSEPDASGNIKMVVTLVKEEDQPNKTAPAPSGETRKAEKHVKFTEPEDKSSDSSDSDDE